MRTGTVVALLLPLLTQLGTASAESKVPEGWHPMGKGFCGTTHATTSTGGARLTSSHVLYVNRCSGGCTFTKGAVANAPQNVHAVQGVQANVSIPEFANHANQTGAAADEEWNAIMACIRETESYYNIQVVDQRPATGSYHMASVGGFDENLGFMSGNGQLLGISQLECGGIDNVISFSLAGESRLLTGNSSDYVRDVCKTVVHEAGHAFGLEHAMRWLDDASSTCSDPMSYDTATCDPSPAYFRNRLASCGTSFGTGQDMPYNCLCGANNPHEKMLAVFGNGAPTVPPPTVAITTPAAGALSNLVAVNAGSKRGIARVDLYLNGWKWGSVPGAKFIAGGGQLNPSPYAFQLPASVPNGNYDIEVRAYDDLEVMGMATGTAVKGAPCADASSCSKGQKCEAGKCFWDQPTAEIGESCTYNEFCLSNLCQGTNAEDAICTRTCIPGVLDSCPADSGLECIQTAVGKGVCFTTADEGGGCCSVDTADSSRTWLHGALSLGVVGLLVVRRRKRR